MKKQLLVIIGLIIGMVLVGACSDEEEQVNPEDSLEEYIRAWETGQFAGMIPVMNEDSVSILNNQDWELEERMTKIYEDLQINNIEISYEPRDFEEEELDLEEVEELVYPVQVSMLTMVGPLDYSTDIKLMKNIYLDENEEEREEWLVEWRPDHIFAGMEAPTDTVIPEFEYPIRGEIYDRNGDPLAVNGEIYRTWFVPDRINDKNETAEAYAEVFDLEVDKVMEMIDQYPDRPDWQAFALKLPLDDPRVRELDEIRIPGVGWGRTDGRQYPYGRELGHVIGYIGPITAEELEERPGQGYRHDSVIGKRGLEQVYEERLRGERGVTLTIKDEEGQVRHVIMKKEPEHGEDLKLTIDASIQAQLTATLGSDAGTAVAMNPMTGEVLAMVSQPAFDSNIRHLRLTDPIEDERDRFQLRFRDIYSPGSVFKPFTAAIGIEEGTLDPTEVITIDDRQWQPDSSWGNYRVTRVNEHVTDVDLETAMKYSDNIYFAQQALAIGDTAFEAWAEKLAFGESVPFEFPLFASSLANDDLSNDILLADTGYGQGQVQMNPVHFTTLYTMFLNEGNVMQPSLLMDNEQKGSPWLEGVISSETAETVLETIIAVVEDPNGTAYRPDAGHNLSIAGKTGTAELKKSQQEEDGEQLGWYVAMDYANKDILVTMMIENVEGRGGSGYVVNRVNEFLSRLR